MLLWDQDPEQEVVAWAWFQGHLGGVVTRETGLVPLGDFSSWWGEGRFLPIQWTPS